MFWIQLVYLTAHYQRRKSSWSKLILDRFFNKVQLFSTVEIIFRGKYKGHIMCYRQGSI